MLSMRAISRFAATYFVGLVLAPIPARGAVDLLILLHPAIKPPAGNRSDHQG